MTGTDAPDAVHLARAGLLRLAEPPAPAVVELVARIGAVAAFDAVIHRSAPPAALAATAARTEGRSAETLRAAAAADLRAAAAVGAYLLGPEDPDWPEAATIGFGMAGGRGVSGAAPPLGLYVRGTLPPDLPGSGVTIVGSRASSPYGERVAADLALGVGDAGLAVVSGGAFGIDTAAHRAAVTSGALSAAVLACGIDRAYPVANAPLLQRISAQGAVISEYPPGTSPARHRFLVRNRLLAALGAVTVVVEASRRSGSLSTAAAAAHLGRTVMAVPGPVTSAMSVGCHLLLRDRFATLATSAQDVLAAVRPVDAGLFDADPFGAGSSTGPAAPAATSSDDRRAGRRSDVRRTDTLDPLSLRVHGALPTRGTATVSELSTSAGVPAPQVMATLPVLELAGLARKEGAVWRRL
ncbi:DNA-processing protein DprA [Nakamurella deserti]|uniref:DNA-processing protein DprA n=1 Tax=Nakamurella deserti TaxID=2164074 RepID=UPI000DBE619D|nr:DNA-processing protein DprA [Nakamurella deserti]